VTIMYIDTPISYDSSTVTVDYTQSSRVLERNNNIIIIIIIIIDRIVLSIGTLS